MEQAWVMPLVYSIFALAIIILVLGTIIFTNDNLYCYIFDHRGYCLWKKLISRSDELIFDYTYNNVSHFIIPKDIVGESGYYVVYWGYNNSYNEFGGITSVHNGAECVLSPFNEVMSRKLGKILETKIPKHD